MTPALAFVCPNGHRRLTHFRMSEGCRECRAEAMATDIVSLLMKAEPVLDEIAIRRTVDRTARSGLPLAQLHEWLEKHPDGLRSGSSDCPKVALRLIFELESQGFSVARPACIDCGKVRKQLPALVDGGRVCMTCYLDRNAEKCSQCGTVARVSRREEDGSATCHRCRLADPGTWRPCGSCDEISQPATTINGITLGTCCYIAPMLRCTVCGIKKGIHPWKTRRPLCADCNELPTLPCSTCGLDAKVPVAEQAALCVRCVTHPPLSCSICSAPTVGRDKNGDPRCFDCYERPVRTCGHCGRVRAIARLATGDEPDLCGICWRGPVMACEGCGRTGPCRGERKDKMLCRNCRPVKPQTCAYCGDTTRAPAAQWHEGPICQPCYNKALAAKADCPQCGTHRRLRCYPAFDVPVCADCAGEPATNVCRSCGIEDWLYENKTCARCVLRGRITKLLGDDTRRQQNGMAPLFDALVVGREPRAVLDWLLKSKKAVAVIKRIAAGELPLSYETIDALESDISVTTARHLESLFTSTNTLAGRDPMLASTERWCAKLLVDIEDVEHKQLLQTYVQWRLLRPLRANAASQLLSDSAGYAVRQKLRTIADFCDYLVAQGRSVTTCEQSDVDGWAASRPAHQSQTLYGFAGWAMSRKAMPRLDTPARRNNLPVVPANTDERWQLAKRLLHEPGFDAAVRLAGALIVIYAQPLHKVSRMRVDDVVIGDRVTVCFGDAVIELPAPLDAHARQVLLERQPDPSTAKLASDAGWLFPGGHPGRPITSTGLSKRLARHGIAAQRQRLAALYQLAGEIPAPLLADLLGISAGTAEIWSRLAGRTWIDYPAMRPENSEWSQSDHVLRTERKEQE